MSDTAAYLRHKIESCNDIQAMVRTMKAMAAANIGQYENAVRSLEDYYRTVQLGLLACLRQKESFREPYVQMKNGGIGAIVFGSDQGMVGQFNEQVLEFAAEKLAALPGKKTVWAVGERIFSHLADSSLPPGKNFTLPNSIAAITPLIGQILLAMEAERDRGEIEQIYVFHNRPLSGNTHAAVMQRLLPLDSKWQRELAATNWPGNNLPEVVGGTDATLPSLVREYLFVSLFRACAESLASENASRLSAMQRAEKNIDELQQSLQQSFHRLRQSVIDEELFDVLSGFEALPP